MFALLMLSRALADEPAQALPEDHPHTALHHKGVNALKVGAITTAVAAPAGALVWVAASPFCHTECMAPLFYGASTAALVGTVGVTTMAVGGVMLAVDAGHKPHDVVIAPTLRGLVVAGRF